MIKKLLSLFPNQWNKTYDLGKLQKSGFIENLPDISACPKCKSKNITWKFYVATDGSESSIPSQTKCNKCGYSDKKGGFEQTNMSLLREEKINKIIQ